MYHCRLSLDLRRWHSVRLLLPWLNARLCLLLCTRLNMTCLVLIHTHTHHCLCWHKWTSFVVSAFSTRLICSGSLSCLEESLVLMDWCEILSCHVAASFFSLLCFFSALDSCRLYDSCMNGIMCCSVSIVVLFSDRRIGMTSTLVYLVERILMSPLLLLAVAGAIGLFALTELGLASSL